MADFYMHKKLVDQFLEQSIADSEFMTLGAQGPDYFYYILNKDKANADAIGSALHTSNTKAFLMTLFQYALDHERPEILDYLLGFLTHYALDQSIHPYIFHYSGVYQKDIPSTHQWGGIHLQFERKVDIAFIKSQYQFEPHKKRLRLEVLPIPKLPDSIVQAIDHSVHSVYGVSGSGALFKKGYQTMGRVECHLVYDFFKIKRHLLKLVTPYKKPRSLYYQDLSHAQKTDDFDYLNLSNQPWKHPVSGQIFTSSVLDLFAAAKEKASQYIKAAKKAYQEKSLDALALILNNASYDTGLDLNASQEMQYFTDYRTLLR